MDLLALAQPASFDASGHLARRADIDAVAQCIEVILGTLPGECEMLPEFGSQCRRRLFEPNDATLAQDLAADTGDAIARWEPRVRLLGTTVNRPGDLSTSVSARFALKGSRPQQSSTATAMLTPTTSSSVAGTAGSS